MKIEPIPDEPAKSLDDEAIDVLDRLQGEYSEAQVVSAVDRMDDVAKFNLVQCLHELERRVRRV